MQRPVGRQARTTTPPSLVQLRVGWHARRSILQSRCLSQEDKHTTRSDPYTAHTRVQTSILRIPVIGYVARGDQRLYYRKTSPSRRSQLICSAIHTHSTRWQSASESTLRTPCSPRRSQLQERPARPQPAERTKQIVCTRFMTALASCFVLCASTSTERPRATRARDTAARDSKRPVQALATTHGANNHKL